MMKTINKNMTLNKIKEWMKRNYIKISMRINQIISMRTNYIKTQSPMEVI